MKGRALLTVSVLVLLLMQSSCSWFRRGSDKCREPTVPAAVDAPPLRAPAGLDAPDTRNAVKVPELKEPERVRTKGDPCMSQPPPYGS